MYTQVKYLYSEADQFSKPLLSEAMPKDVFMAHVRKAVETLYIRTRTMLHNHRNRAKEFGLIIKDDIAYPLEWNAMKAWFSLYFLKAESQHIIRYLV